MESPNDPPYLRRDLRQATLVLPRTGERVKRTFTLRTPDSEREEESPQVGSSDEERTPLLPSHQHILRQHRRRPPLRWPTHGTKGVVPRARRQAARAYAFATSKTGVNVLKCSLSYLLGSMATFVPPLSDFLGRHNEGKHMVATVTVYFHAARSAGSMVEATYLALFAFAYAAFISFTSMAVSILFDSRGMLVLGHAIVLVVFCGGGLGLIGWTKQKLANPLVNVACSLTSLALITVLTKEGAVQDATFSYHKVFQVLKMIIMGIIASTCVSLLIRPVSARKELRESLVRTTDLLGELLTNITRSFLSGNEADLQNPGFVTTSNKTKSAFGTLTKQLREARNEHYALGTEDEYVIEARLVKCLEELAQNIGGLRSAATTQFALIRKPPSQGLATPMTPGSELSRHNSFVTLSPAPGLDLSAVGESIGGLTSISETPEEGSEAEDREGPVGRLLVRMPKGMPGTLGTGTSPDDIFAIFITHLGPPMKSLAYTLKEVLDELPFAGPDYRISINCHFRASLVDAIALFSRARKEALALLYQTKILTRARAVEVAADFEEVAASCGYFSSSLQDFAEEMLTYLDILEELKLELEQGHRRRSWKWLLFWRAERDELRSNPIPNAVAAESTEGLSSSRTPVTAQPVPLSWQEPQKAPQRRPFTQKLWHATRVLRRDDIKYAVKVGLGAMLYAIWSFIPATRPVYSLWRGEWGLLSYMLVCSMTIGASNTTGFQRFSGTCLGALCAVLAWLISFANPFVLAAIGWAVSVPCFYIIVGLGKGPLGRFIMLTYNLSCLYAYSLSVTDTDGDGIPEGEDEGGPHPLIWQIVLHRVVAVMAGCIWGIVVTRVVWPISAREKLQSGLSLLWLRMALIWKRDPLAILVEDPSPPPQPSTTTAPTATTPSPSTTTTSGLRITTTTRGGEGGTGMSGATPSGPQRSTTTTTITNPGTPPSYLDIRESLELRRFLRHLEGLQKSAASEFELRGPFENDIFGRILAGTDRMVDAFHSIRVVIAKDLKASPGEAALLRHTRNERRQLSRRISHLFSVLASSMKMAYPLNDALPNVENARDRLLAKIYEFRKNGEGQDVATDEDYELLYAYALVTGQLAQDIQAVGADIEKLYGVLNEEDLKLQ